ncbi:MAG: sigma-70 family RNA polymerase sigma factor [Bacteroidetes bacterium]|nr:sigma-70 family RNA polymerase sigma factor [Bacteroidota bacterium]
MKSELNPASWVDNYADFLYSIAMYKLNDPVQAKDIVQETFLSAFSAKDNFRGDASEKTWLTVILKNKITDYFRAAKNLESLDKYLEDGNRNFAEQYYDTMADSYGHTNATFWMAQDSADKMLNQTEARKVIHYCLHKMPEKLRMIFWAKYFDEKKADEICKDFCITKSNYWVMLHRVKALLQVCIKKTGGI